MGCEEFCGLTKDEQRDFVRTRNEKGFRWSRDYDKIYSELYKYAHSLVYSYKDMDGIKKDEIMAALPLKIVQCMKTVRGGSLLTTMLNKIVTNTISDFHRTKKSKVYLRIDDLFPDNEYSWDIAVARNLDLVDEFPIDRLYRVQKVREAIKKLSPDHQQIINLSFYDGVDDESIAKMLKIPADTVRTRKHYAKKHLKRYLTGKELF